MQTRYVLIASAALAIAPAAGAEPAKPDVRPQAQPTDRPAAVVLASAEQVRPPVPAGEEQAAVPAKKPRAARVTSCRCANQTPER